MKSVRERIIAALVAKLARVRTGSGYEVDCGANVYREKSRLTPAELPAYVVFPGDEEAERGHGYTACEMNISVEGHALFGTADPSEVKEQILADTIRVITDRRSIADTTGGLADDVYYAGGGNFAAVEAGDVAVGVTVLFKIKYKYKTGDPFATT